MAITPDTQVNYVGDGVTTLFAFAFPYEQAADVYCTIDGVITSFTFSTPAVINVTPAPAVDAEVAIYRSTPASSTRYVFSTGVPFLTKFADANWKQLLYTLQEVVQGIKNNAFGLTKALRTADELSILPNAATRANKLVAFDNDGAPTVLEYLPTEVPALDARTTALEGRATAVEGRTSILETWADGLLTSLYNIFPRKIATWADIATITPVGAGQIFHLVQHTAGGLGGGVFASVSGSIADDGGCNKNCAPGSGYYLKRINYSTIDVSMFGARGVGIETSQFQAAYDYAAVGSAIIVPTGVYTIGTLTGTKLVYWLASGVLDGSGNPLNLPGIVDTTYNSANGAKRQVWLRKSTPNQETVYQFIREANHTGGTGGNTSACVAVKTIVSAGATNYEWPLKVELENYSTGADNSENSATFFSALKFGTCPTWAITTQVIDYQTTAANGAVISCELGLAGNGTDASLQRNMLQLAPNVRVPLGSGGTFYEIGRGIFAAGLLGSLCYRRTFASEGAFKESAFFNNADSSGFAGSATVKDVGKSSYGIDLSGATYGAAAIKLAANQLIYFEATNTVAMRFNSANGYLEFLYGGVVKGHIDFSLADHAL